MRKGAVDSYTLEGTDGGVDEMRRILFEQGQLPKFCSSNSGEDRWCGPQGLRLGRPWLWFRVLKCCQSCVPVLHGI